MNRHVGRQDELIVYGLNVIFYNPWPGRVGSAPCDVTPNELCQACDEGGAPCIQ